MKSVVITKPHEYQVIDVPIPKVGDDEVLIQMKAAGVCGSDFHIFHGKNPCSSYPLVPGHENVGIVSQVGKNVSKIKVGDHVVVDLVITCGECYQCRHGRKNVCENVLVRGSGTDGGWREYFTAPEKDVYVIDPKLPFKDAALIEPFAIGGHCCKRGRVTAEDRVLILGTGTIGSIILQTCKMIGAMVICADINPDTLKRAQKYGADYAINSKQENLVERVLELTYGKGVTVAFDSACFQGSLTSLLAPGLVCNAGRVVSLGFCSDPESISQAMIDKPELDIIGSRMSAYQFEPTAKNMAEGKYNMDELVSHYIPFSKIDEVFYHIDHPNPSVKKMVIVFDE